MSDELPESSKPLRIAGIDISSADQTPLVLALLAVIQRLEVENKELRDDIQLSGILLNGHDAFHEEKDQLLPVSVVVRARIR